MSAAGRNRVSLADYRQRKADEGALDIELSDGSVVTVPPPELWPDGVQEALEANRHVDACRIMLGDEAWERFTADGGSAMTLMAMAQEELGSTLGESSASSRS